MSVQFIGRAQALTLNAGFTAAFCGLQRVVFDETPRLWERGAVANSLLQHAGNRVWRAVGRSTRTDHYVIRLGRALGQLLAAVGAAQWTVLALHPRANWAGAKDGRPAYPPLARARAALMQAGPGRPRMSRRFAGAIQFDAEGAALAVPLWFWVSRCQAMPGAVQAFAGELPLVASLCQYGNLHIEAYDHGLLRRLDDLAADCGFAPIEGTTCRELFGRAGRADDANVGAVGIAGRTLRV